MPATIDIQEANGAIPDWHTITAARFCASDTHDPALSYPIPIPNTGFRYSYWKTISLLLTGIGSYVAHIRFYGDGAIGWDFGSGGGLFVGTKDSGDNGIAVEDYDQATGAEGVTGHAMNDGTNGHAIYKTAGYDIENVNSFIAATPLIVDSSVITEDGRCKCVVLQAKIDILANGAEPGVHAGETLYWRYDEI